MGQEINRNLVFVVCHPDDEALWVGGVLRGFSQFEELNVYVVCLSGAAEADRKMEFKSAESIAGYKAGIIMGGKLRKATDPLPSVPATLMGGLREVNLDPHEVDLLVTHAPYGDEHMHPHHVQACEELYQWAEKQSIPFACFSCVPFPNGALVPILRNMKRLGGLQLLNFAWVRYGLLRKVFRFIEGKPWRYPVAYVQWQVDAIAKREMLNSYQSIDLESHARGYAMFSSNVESLYLFDNRGIDLIGRLISAMEVPGASDFFSGSWTDDNIRQRILRKLSFWRH